MLGDINARASKYFRTGGLALAAAKASSNNPWPNPQPTRHNRDGGVCFFYKKPPVIQGLNSYRM
jgi:hypothetical protein